MRSWKAPRWVLTVGPDGGFFGSPNGVILGVPPGALGELGDIRVKELPSDSTGEAQLIRCRLALSVFPAQATTICCEPSSCLMICALPR